MKKIIIIVVGVLLIGGAAYFIFGSKNTEDTGEDMMEASSGEAKNIVEEVEEGAFTGTLMAAVKMGVPMKCTYEVNGAEYEGIIKGEQYKGSVSMPDGRTGNVIMKENCMYTWAEGEAQGMKLCFTDEEQSMWDQTDTTENFPGTYNCLPSVVTDADFELPAGVEFMDLDAMMQDVGMEDFDMEQFEE